MRFVAAKNLRSWWASPPRRGLHRFIFPWEFRHLRGFGIVRVAGGCLAAVAGVVCLFYGANAWAAFFLAVAALDLAVGWWYVRSTAPRDEHRQPPG